MMLMRQVIIWTCLTHDYYYLWSRILPFSSVIDQGFYWSLSWCQSRCSQGLRVTEHNNSRTIRSLSLLSSQAHLWNKCFCRGPWQNVVVSHKISAISFHSADLQRTGEVWLSKVKKLSLESIYAKTADHPFEL